MPAVVKPLEPSISGVMVGQHLEVLSERYGAAVVREVRTSLPEDQSRELESVIAVDWVRIGTFEAFYAAMARRTGRSVPDLHTQTGRVCVERAFRSVWRLLLRFTTDEALVSRTPLLHAKAFNTGSLSSRLVSKGRAEIELTGWPGTPEFVRRGLKIGIGTVLELSGRKGAVVADEARRDGIMYKVTWQS